MEFNFIYKIKENEFFDVRIHASINCYIFPYTLDVCVNEYLRVSRKKSWMAVLSYRLPSYLSEFI